MLRPSAEVNEVVGGVLARAVQKSAGNVRLHAFTFASNHFHLLVWARGAALAGFMQYLRANLVPQAGEEEASARLEVAARTERMKQRTPRVDWAELLSRTFDFDVFVYVRCGGRLKGVDVREGRGWSASDCGAPGPGHGRCEAGPGARAPPERVVLRPEPPQPRAPSPAPLLLGRRPEQACSPRGCAASPPPGALLGPPPSAALLRPCAPALSLHTPSILPMSLRRHLRAPRLPQRPSPGPGPQRALSALRHGRRGLCSCGRARLCAEGSPGP